MRIKKIINLLFLSLLVILSIVSHPVWFNLKSILTFSDWYYWPSEAVRQLYNSWGTWLGFWGLGSVNIQIYFNPFTATWSLLERMGFSYDVATKFTFFIPISFLGFISPYLLIKKFIGDNLISFISALFYGSVTYFLILQTSHLTIAFVYSITPFILFSFIKSLEINRPYSWVLFSLFYSIGIYYEVRIMYITTFLLMCYFIYFHLFQLKKYFTSLMFSGSIILLLNLFWLLPVILGGAFREIGLIANRSIFGDSLTNINYALTLFHSSWTGSFPDQTFSSQSIMTYFWTIPIIVFIPLIFKKNQYKKSMVFFLIVSLVGIFLVKQSSNPFSYVYNILFKYFPGFNLFRESSKFILLISIGYLGLLSYGLLLIKNNFRKTFFFLAIFLIGFIVFLNVYPLINGSIGTLFVSRSEPKSFRMVDSYLVKEKSYFRTLWIPVYSRWSFFEDNNPEVSAEDTLNTSWNKYVVDKQKNKKYSDGKLIIYLLNKPYAQFLLNLSSIKYVFVPLEDKANDDDFFVYYGESRQYYINQLDNISWLHKINIGTKDIVVYENKSYKPHIYLTSEKETIAKNLEYKTISLKFITPTEYKISLTNIKAPVYLNFSEAYHPSWKIRVGQFNWLDVLTKKNYFLSDKYHFQNDAGLNSYLIDPKAICKVESCKVNTDGSYDIDMTLYFAPQSYMDLGLMISGGTLAIVLSSLLFVLGRSIYVKRKN